MHSVSEACKFIPNLFHPPPLPPPQSTPRTHSHPHLAAAGESRDKGGGGSLLVTFHPHKGEAEWSCVGSEVLAYNAKTIEFLGCYWCSPFLYVCMIVWRCVTHMMKMEGAIHTMGDREYFLVERAEKETSLEKRKERQTNCH